MPGAVAAIGGVRRGRAKGRAIARQRQAHRQAQYDLEKKRQQRMAEEIIGRYDKDASGGLSKTELKPVISDYTAQIYGEDVRPSSDDIDFLFNLCDRAPGTKGENGSIEKEEVMWILDAWGEFMKERHFFVELFLRGDEDQSGSIDKDELQEILDEVKDDDKLKLIQPEVVAWIFEEADLSRTGVLSVMELARALCAYNMWLGKRTRCLVAPDRMLFDIRNDPGIVRPEIMNDKDWKAFVEQRDRILEILRPFNFDSDSPFEIQRMADILVRLGIVEPEESMKVAKLMDRNGDDVVTVEEFLAWLYCGNEAANQARTKMDPSAKSASRSCVVS